MRDGIPDLAGEYGVLPALVTPAGFTADGLPVGLSRPYEEPTLIAIAAGHEVHTNVRILPPTILAIEG